MWRSIGECHSFSTYVTFLNIQKFPTFLNIQKFLSEVFDKKFLQKFSADVFYGCCHLLQDKGEA